jgi:hypothetical protein
MNQIAMHVAHDGMPAGLRWLGKRTELTQLTELLFSALRRDPANRPPAATLRKELARIRPPLESLPWPLGAKK